MMREHCNPQELDAHQLLDMVRAGVEGIPDERIKWTLITLGDGLGPGSMWWQK